MGLDMGAHQNGSHISLTPSSSNQCGMGLENTFSSQHSVGSNSHMVLDPMTAPPPDMLIMTPQPPWFSTSGPPPTYAGRTQAGGFTTPAPPPFSGTADGDMSAADTFGLSKLCSQYEEYNPLDDEGVGDGPQQVPGPPPPPPSFGVQHSTATSSGVSDSRARTHTTLISSAVKLEGISEGGDGLSGSKEAKVSIAGSQDSKATVVQVSKRKRKDVGKNEAAYQSTESAVSSRLWCAQ